MFTGNNAYNTKLKKYDDYSCKQDVLFQPFVIEEFGSVHKEGMKIFNRLCEFISIRKDRELTEVKFEYSKLLSSSIKRHN